MQRTPRKRIRLNRVDHNNSNIVPTDTAIIVGHKQFDVVLLMRLHSQKPTLLVRRVAIRSSGASRSHWGRKRPGSRCRQAHPITKKPLVMPRMGGSAPKISNCIVGITARKVFPDQALKDVSLSFVCWIYVMEASTQHCLVHPSLLIAL